MTWTDSLLGQPGNYAPIIQSLTPHDGQVLEMLVGLLSGHATQTQQTLEGYAMQGVCVGLGDLGELPSLATLKAIGLIVTADFVHIGLTPLGLGFLQTMLSAEP
jgi:hypothetical protein